MNIVLLDTAFTLWNSDIFLRHSILDPIGIEYLAAVAVKNGHNAKVLPTNIGDPDMISIISQLDFDVIGLSLMTFTIPLALKFIRKIKKHNPTIKTILGGYHASSCPEIVKDASIDFIVIGEGEKTFIELINTLNSTGDVSKVKGTAYWDGKLQVNEPRERIYNLDVLPFPLRDKEILRKCKIAGLSYPPPSKQKSVCQITYSRGCPYNCIFCNSPQLWGRQVRWRSAKNLVDEIEYLQQQFDTNMVFFTDLTFDLNKIKVYELCHEINNRQVEINWYAMCRPDHVNKDLLLRMKEAGCTKISYGVDSVNNNTLPKIKPWQNVDLKKIRLGLELTNDIGFIVKAYVMFGYPWEDKNSIQETGKILRNLAIDELRISFFTPFPGTPIYEEYKKEGLLLTEDFSKYTSDEPIVKVNNLAPKELIEYREIIFKEFYQSQDYETRKKEKINRFPHLKQSYDELNDFLYNKGVLE